MASFEANHVNSGSSPYAIAPRMLLASLALAAGAVHLAMVPIHAPESTTDALLFAGAGWVQVLLGIALLVRPSREVLGLAIVVSAGILVAYAFSRTTGLPWGAHAGEAEDVAGIDIMVAVLEGVLIVGALALLVRPDFGRGRDGVSMFSIESLAIASAFPIVVLFATSVMLVDPDLIEHGHGDGGGLVSSAGHGHGGDGSVDLVSLAENRCDLGFNPAAYWRETAIAGIDTITGGETVMVDHNASAYVTGSAELDKLVSTQMTVEGEAGDAAMVLELAKVSDETYVEWLRWLGVSGASHGHGSALAPDDNQGMGGHLGPQPWHAMTDQAQCDQLEEELALARETALKYPTVADAKAAGWRQVTGYVPGIAAHFMNFSMVDGEFNIEEPEMILYDGTDDDSAVIGLSYYVIHRGSAEPTQGFTGNNDHFHRHDGLCVNETGVIGDSTTTEEECTAMGGRKANGSAGWMNHVWIVPGCESPWGVFSGASPLLDSELTKNSTTDGGGCAGSGMRSRYDLSPGEPKNVPTSVGGEVDLVVSN